MKRLLVLFTLLFIASGNAQNASVQVTAVDAAALKTIAQKSEKKNTLFYTFGIWCEPCRLHLPNALKTAKENNLDFYVIIVDSQQSDKTQKAVAYLKGLDKDVKIAVLSDAVYGDKTSKRNKKFVKEITPPQLEAIDDFSKYILLNQKGEVLMVTIWKDNKGNDWKDDSKMVKEKILPLLSK